VREADEVLPLFVLDRELLRGSCGSPRRIAFLHGCLDDLDGELRRRGGRLIVRSGDVVAEAMALAREWDAQALHLSADTTPYGRARERRLAAACRRERVALRTFPGIVVHPAGTLVPHGGDHYRVFTPYWRAWRAAPLSLLPTAPRAVRQPHAARGLGTGALRRELAASAPGPGPAAGEGEGRRLLERWLRGGLSRYPRLRDDLAAAATSRLSAHLHLGCLPPQVVLDRSDGRPGGEELARQLCWRDFHHQVLAARPQMTHADYRPRAIRWRTDPEALAAWRDGLTGYPIVDAGMRQLGAEGFIHNRARLIVASFLTKTLGIDWRRGAAHFARLLVDADVANNVGNWQWVAGTGNDTRPNRVLNPLRQADRFDPHGDYVRRWLPELAAVPGARVHRPWRLPAAERARLDYPDPIAELHAGRRRASGGR
jgi:deoxyribodipyrimidine photo-lyase